MPTRTQRTSDDKTVKPVSAGLAKTIGRMVDDVARRYPGGLAKLELVKGDPDFISELYRHFDARAAKRAKDLEPKPPILELVKTIEQPALPVFTAADHFKTKGAPDGVKIGYLGDNFRRHFLSKEEAAVPAAKLHINRLKQSSVDGPIITELGGEEVVETTLSQQWNMMKAQPNGERGDLHTGGYANIFYIRDNEGALWAVSAGWCAGYDGWYVGALPVARPDQWYAGYQVLSR